MVRKSNNNNKQEQKCQGYYEVSGYTTKEGKHVDDYIRQCWKHSNGGGIVDNPQNVNSKGISDEDEPIFQMPQTKENTLPTDDSIPSDIPNDNGIDNPFDLANLLDLMFSINTQRNGNGYYTPQPQRFGYNPVNYEDSPYQKFPFSTYDTKTTQEKIKQSNKELEEILKQREISNKDVETMRNSLRNTIGTLCQDIEALSDMKAGLPKNPTVESTQMSERIEKEREKTLDNASDAIFLAFNIKKVYDAEFDNADMNSEDYYTRLGNHAKRLDELNAMSESLKTLFDASKEINEGTKSKVQQVREKLNLPKTATQPYTQNATQFPTSITYPSGYDIEKRVDLKETSLMSYGKNSDDYLREINFELHKLERDEYNSGKVLKKYSENDRFNRLKELVEALFYVIRNEKISPNDKIYEFKKEMQEQLYEYDQSTYPKRQRKLGPLKFSLKDILYSYIIWEQNKQYGDTIRLLVFLRYLWLWKITNDELEKFYKRPDINITNKELAIKNDMRHITGLVFYTQKYGAEQARKYGYLKEKLDFYQEGDIQDTFIDFDNNERGIAFGVKYKNLNKEETIEKIYEEFIKNKR